LIRQSGPDPQRTSSGDKDAEEVLEGPESFYPISKWQHGRKLSATLFLHKKKNADADHLSGSFNEDEVNDVRPQLKEMKVSRRQHP
jgi:hypothetical protein